MTIYNLLYVGKLYSVARFEAEAEKHGVARALPAPFVGKLKWGDPIMLAQWEPNQEAQRESRTTQMTVEGQKGHVSFKRIGSAKVFGYFHVTGLNMSVVGGGSTADLAKDALSRKLRIVRFVVGPGRVDRVCGSYGISSTAFVEDTLEEIMAKAKEVEQSMGVKFKWFVAGRYVRIDDPVVLDPCQFTRGVLKVEVDGDLLPQGEFEPGINFIFDYKRKLYAPKEEEQ